MTVTQIDVQVHLGDRRCVAELKRVVRQTLRRAARTWAPLPLPIDRVVVGVGFPAGGRVDLYDQFPGRDTASHAPSRPFAVVSLGLRDGQRELEPVEVAGALAAQIQAVINEQRGLRSMAPRPEAAPVAAAVARSATARPTSSASRPTTATSATTGAAQVTPGANGASLVDTSLPRLQDLLATVQQGQPLEVAGPSANHTNP